ncbi:hypothetical protein RHGRI_014757 [Rhododendron griersonianum]|uniref:Uncharacterized protein n=1 Tax=Rhododendron griersonianum TaxID=479676 RepID=A0AAV6KBF1_9ERIC|nr:hypothetical protein RHGRI_014757 [Rhododendron griersonianum]
MNNLSSMGMLNDVNSNDGAPLIEMIFLSSPAAPILLEGLKDNWVSWVSSNDA